MGVSQVELAERLENTQTFVSKCERGRRIDAVELVEFAEALGVQPLELMGEYLEQRNRGVASGRFSLERLVEISNLLGFTLAELAHEAAVQENRAAHPLRSAGKRAGVR